MPPRRTQAAAPFSTDRSDEALLVQTGRGDPRAFDELVARHRERVIGLISRMVGSEGAEDIAQEAFVRLFRAASRYRPSARFTTYLYRLVANLCIEESRKRARSHSTAMGAADDLGGSRPSTESEYLDRETARQIEAALARLPESQRLAVVLCRFEGRSYREIAEVLGVTEKSVEALLYRARQTLARELLER